jgi:ubiquinone/menaquinone biosynthesis C-methylase UbiE
VKTVQAFLSELNLDLAHPPTSPYKMQKVLDLGGESVLDIGCRDGAYMAFCRAMGKRVVGLDLAPSPPPGSDLPLVRANAQALPFADHSFDTQALPFADHSFDTVLMFDILEHASDEELALREAARVGRRNVLLSLPKPDNPKIFNPWNGLTYGHYTDPEHQRYYTPNHIQELVKCLGYRVISLEHWCPIHPADVYIGVGAPRLLCRLADRVMWMFIHDKPIFMRNLFVEVSLGG